MNGNKEILNIANSMFINSRRGRRNKYDEKKYLCFVVFKYLYFKEYFVEKDSTYGANTIYFDNSKYNFVIPAFVKIGKYVKKHATKLVNNNTTVVLTKPDSYMEEYVWIVNKIRDSIVHGMYDIDWNNRCIKIVNDVEPDKYEFVVDIPFSILDFDLSKKHMNTNNFNSFNTEYEDYLDIDIYYKRLISGDNFTERELNDYRELLDRYIYNYSKVSVDSINRMNIGLYENDVYSTVLDMLANGKKNIREMGIVPNYRFLCQTMVHDFRSLLSDRKIFHEVMDEDDLFFYLFTNCFFMCYEGSRDKLKHYNLLKFIPKVYFRETPVKIIPFEYSLEEMFKVYKRFADSYNDDINSTYDNPRNAVLSAKTAKLLYSLSDLFKWVGELNYNIETIIRNSVEHMHFKDKEDRVVFTDYAKKGGNVIKVVNYKKSFMKLLDELDSPQGSFTLGSLIAYIKRSCVSKNDKAKVEYNIITALEFFLYRKVELTEEIDDIFNKLEMRINTLNTNKSAIYLEEKKLEKTL